MEYDELRYTGSIVYVPSGRRVQFRTVLAIRGESPT